MIEFMEDLYEVFISPYVKSRPKDELYTHYFKRHEQAASLDEKDNVYMIQKFCAIHAFVLGMRMGLALSDDLKGRG